MSVSLVTCRRSIGANQIFTWRRLMAKGALTPATAAEEVLPAAEFVAAGIWDSAPLQAGLTTKIHALVDANGLPIALKLTAGQAHDGHSAAGMLDTDGDVLLADRAYDSDALRTELAARGAWANIKANVQPQATPRLQRVPLSLRKCRRALLQPTQAVPSRGDPL